MIDAIIVAVRFPDGVVLSLLLLICAIFALALYLIVLLPIGTVVLPFSWLYAAGTQSKQQIRESWLVRWPFFELCSEPVGELWKRIGWLSKWVFNTEHGIAPPPAADT